VRHPRRGRHSAQTTVTCRRAPALQRCQCRSTGTGGSGRQQVLERCGPTPLARGLEHRVVGQLEELGRGVPGDHGAQVQPSAPSRCGAGRPAASTTSMPPVAPPPRAAGCRCAPTTARPAARPAARCQRRHARPRADAAGRRQPQQAGKGSGHAQAVPQQARVIGLPVVTAEPTAVQHQPAKNSAAVARVRAASRCAGRTRRSHTSPHRPAMANGRLLSTSSAQGSPSQRALVGKVCWCALAGSGGPPHARASSAAAPAAGRLRPGGWRQRGKVCAKSEGGTEGHGRCSWGVGDRCRAVCTARWLFGQKVASVLLEAPWVSIIDTHEHHRRPRAALKKGTQDRPDDLRRPGAGAGHGRVQRQAHAGQGRHAAVAHRRHLPRAGAGLCRPGPACGRQAAAAQGADAEQERPWWPTRSCC
jgi:hypothetical protein